MDQIKACQRISSVFDMSSGILCCSLNCTKENLKHHVILPITKPKSRTGMQRTETIPRIR